MRKTIVTALVTLLVMLAVVSCDNIITPGAEKLEFTADGRQLKELKVNTGVTTGNGRSITATTAQELDAYREVIFTDGTDYYRAVGYKGQDLTIKLPLDTTFTVNQAIVLLGTAEYTLLGIGVLEDTLEVKASTTSITFKATTITVDLSPGAATPSFVITEDANLGTTFAGKTKNGLYNGSARFQVPTGATGISATLTFGGINNAKGTILKVVTTTDPLVKFNIIDAPEAITPTVTALTHLGGTSDTTSGKISFTFGTPATEGKYFITFKIPVRAFDKDEAKLSIWNIRAGTVYSDLTFTNDKYEGLVLLVNESPSPMAELPIVIEP